MIPKKIEREVELALLENINDNLRGIHETLDEISANLDCLSKLEDLVNVIGKFTDKFKDIILDAAHTARR